MEKLSIYNPALVQYLVFYKEKSPSDTKKKPAPVKVGFDEGFAKGSQVIEESDYLVVELHQDVETKNGTQGSQDQVRKVGQVGIVGGGAPVSEGEGWTDLEDGKLVEQIKRIKTAGEKTAQRTLKDNKSLRFVGSYSLIACGSKKNYWLESKIDVKGFMQGGKARRLKEVSSSSRIKSLNWMLTGSNQFRGNALGLTGTPSNLFGLGTTSYRQMEKFKGIFLLDIPMESESESESPAEIRDRYNSRKENVSRNLGKFLAFHSLMLNHNRMEYTDVDRQANILRREVLNIQERIFHLQKGEGENNKSEELADLHKMRTEEEDLLTSAQITFSAVTRLEQTIGTNLYTCFGLNKSLEEIIDSMAPGRIDTVEGEFEPVSSMFDEFGRFNDSLTAAYEMLRDNVNITQTTLRNSLEVLRTFIEHQRSKIEERKSRTFSMILVIFACFGIADALSNVLAYYISERTTTAAYWTVGAFVFSMFFSLMIFGVLYIWIIKKVL